MHINERQPSEQSEVFFFSKFKRSIKYNDEPILIERWLNVGGKTLSMKMIRLGSNFDSIGFPFFRLFIEIET